MEKKLTKRVFALALAALLVLSGCGGGGAGSSSTAASESTPAASTSETPQGEVFELGTTDEEIYMNTLGTFYDAYLAAMEAPTVSETYAMLAVAEAKALEASGGTPLYGSPAAYTMTRIVYSSSGYVPWRGIMDDFTQYVITNDIITAEQNQYLKELRTELMGTGTYIEKAKEYLTGEGHTFTDTFHGTFADNPTTWNHFAGSTGTDNAVALPTFDFLYSYDAEGTQQPHMAESYTMSEDGKVFTFKIREGMRWVDSQGRAEYGEVTADDWVAAAQHQADMNDAYLMNQFVDGMTEYMTGETTDFGSVGVKAPDTYTLEYTLREPAPYFFSVIMRSEFLPLPRAYFIAQGGAFGQADYATASAAPSYRYGTSQDNILYCGPYRCVNMTERNSVNYVLNEEFWNAANMEITEVQYAYNDSSDVSREYNDFTAGLAVNMFLRAATLEQAQANGDFDKYAATTDPGKATFMFWFNMNRQAYASVADGSCPSNKSDAAKELSRAAMQNRHFRLALASSIDRANYLAQNLGEDMKYLSLRNTIAPGTYVKLEEDVTVDINGQPAAFPAGTWYGTIIQAQLDADGFPVQVWDAEKETSEGWDAWYNPERAAAELETAIEQLATLGFEVSEENPIVVDFPYAAFSEQGTNQAVVLKTSIEGALGGRVLFDLIDMDDTTELQNVANNVANGSEVNTDMWLSAFGADHGDPRCYQVPMLPYGDGSRTEYMGLW